MLAILFYSTYYEGMEETPTVPFGYSHEPIAPSAQDMLIRESRAVNH